MTELISEEPGIVDTNVLIYAYDPTDGVKRDRAIELLAALLLSRPICGTGVPWVPLICLSASTSGLDISNICCRHSSDQSYVNSDSEVEAIGIRIGRVRANELLVF